MAGAPGSHRGGSRVRFPLPDHGHVRHLVQLRVPDAVIQRVAALVHGRADARRPQPFVQSAGRGRLGGRDREHANLLGREPQRKRPREVLDQESDEPLQCAVDRPVDHDRPVRPVILARVLELEALGLLEVQLDRRALPFATDGVVELDVDLRSVERAAALIDAVRGAAMFQRLLERALRLVPRRVAAQFLLGASGQVEPIREPERLPQHQLHDVEQLEDLLLDLVLAQEQVGVVHREPAHAQHAVQRPRALVAIHIRDLGEADRQVAIAALLRRVDQDVHRAVHRLHPVAHTLGLALARRHRRELVLGVQRQVPGAQEQLLTRHVGRVHQLIAALENHVLDEASQLEVEHRPLGVPQNQSRADVLLNRKQIELLAQHTMVALLGLLEPAQVAVEVILGEPGRAVDALQHLAALVAAPVRAGRVQQLEVLDPPGARHVRPAAQVHERAVGIDGDHLVGTEVVDPLEFERVVFEALLGFRA